MSKRVQSTDRTEVARHGQPIAILGLFASLAVGVLLLLLFRDPLTEILSQGRERASDPDVVQANDWFVTLLSNVELIFVLISVFGLIVIAVYRSSFANI